MQLDDRPKELHNPFLEKFLNNRGLISQGTNKGNKISRKGRNLPSLGQSFIVSRDIGYALVGCA